MNRTVVLHRGTERKLIYSPDSFDYAGLIFL
jgi:hypothetical protein